MQAVKGAPGVRGRGYPRVLLYHAADAGGHAYFTLIACVDDAPSEIAKISVKTAGRMLRQVIDEAREYAAARFGAGRTMYTHRLDRESLEWVCGRWP